MFLRPAQPGADQTVRQAQLGRHLRDRAATTDRCNCFALERLRKAPAPYRVLGHRHLQALQPTRGVRESGASPVLRLLRGETLLDGIVLQRLIGDRSYDTDAMRAWCAERGIEVVIPSKRNRKVQIPHDRERYRTRHRIENLFCRVKDWTRIILRNDRTSRSYAGFVSLAFALINIQLCP